MGHQTKNPSFKGRARSAPGAPKAFPRRHAQSRVFRYPDFRIGLLTAVFPSRRLSRDSDALCGFRPRLQWRGRAGFTPASLLFTFYGRFYSSRSGLRKQALFVSWLPLGATPECCCIGVGRDTSQGRRGRVNFCLTSRAVTLSSSTTSASRNTVRIRGGSAAVIGDARWRGESRSLSDGLLSRTGRRQGAVDPRARRPWPSSSPWPCFSFSFFSIFSSGPSRRRSSSLRASSLRGRAALSSSGSTADPGSSIFRSSASTCGTSSRSTR